MAFFKYLLYALAGIGLGLAVGYAWHQILITTNPENFYHEQWKTTDEDPTGIATGDSAMSTSQGVAIISVRGGTSHDFGEFVSGSIYTHDYVIENKGDGPMRIWIDERSEGPVSIDLNNEKVVLRPGTTFPVTVTLDAANLEEPFSQSFKLLTDIADTGEIELTVSGKPKTE